MSAPRPLRIAVDASRPLAAEPMSGHNRFHPAIEPVAAVRPGQAAVLETRDASDALLTRASAHADLLTFPMGVAHPLTGPLLVEGAQPGDLLEVELLDVTTADFGIAAVVPGAGLLGDLIEAPHLSKWALGAEVARSDELPGAAIPAAPFPGVVGVAPSPERLAAVRERERRLREAGGEVPDDAPADAVPAAASDGLRTLPPRETGGNLDARRLTRGARLLLPVDVPGALLSLGDLHYAQGDGELCGTGIETAGAVELRCRVHRGGTWRPSGPVVLAPPDVPRARMQFVGLPLAPDGANADGDLRLAARDAALACAAWLEAQIGYDLAQACALMSLAADLQVTQVVNRPNVSVSAALALDVLERLPRDPLAGELSRWLP